MAEWLRRLTAIHPYIALLAYQLSVGFTRVGSNPTDVEHKSFCQFGFGVFFVAAAVFSERFCLWSEYTRVG